MGKCFGTTLGRISGRLPCHKQGEWTWEEILVRFSPKWRRVHALVSAAQLLQLVPEEVLGPKCVSFFIGNVWRQRTWCILSRSCIYWSSLWPCWEVSKPFVSPGILINSELVSASSGHCPPSSSAETAVKCCLCIGSDASSFISQAGLYMGKLTGVYLNPSLCFTSWRAADDIAHWYRQFPSLSVWFWDPVGVGMMQDAKWGIQQICNRCITV